MCTTKFLTSRKCRHTWSEIVTPCGEDKGFSTCPAFKDGRIREEVGLYATFAPAEPCPRCDKEDDYDGNMVRMVKSTTFGFRWGMGGGRTNLGVDCPIDTNPGFNRERGIVMCCVVM